MQRSTNKAKSPTPFDEKAALHWAKHLAEQKNKAEQPLQALKETLLKKLHAHSANLKKLTQIGCAGDQKCSLDIRHMIEKHSLESLMSVNSEFSSFQTQEIKSDFYCIQKIIQDEIQQKENEIKSIQFVNDNKVREFYCEVRQMAF